MGVRVVAFSSLVVALLVGGCSASPEKVCNHMKGLLENEKATQIDVKVGNCTRNVQKAKDAHPDRWDACAKCSLDAGTMAAFDACASTCEGR